MYDQAQDFATKASVVGNSSAAQAQLAGQQAAGAFYQGYVATPPSKPSPAVTVIDIINRAGPLLERLRKVANGMDAMGQKLVGPQPQPNPPQVGSASSAMPGSLGELSHLLHLSHVTLGRIEDGLRLLHELHG